MSAFWIGFLAIPALFLLILVLGCLKSLAVAPTTTVGATATVSTKAPTLAGGTFVLIKKMSWVMVPFFWLLTLLKWLAVPAVLILFGWAVWTYWLSPTRTITAPVGQWSGEVRITAAECIRWYPKTSTDKFLTEYRDPNNVWRSYHVGSLPDMWGVRFKSADETRPAEIEVTVKSRGDC